MPTPLTKNISALTRPLASLLSLSMPTACVYIQVENLEAQSKEWSSPPVIPELKLPGPNPFVPQDLSVIVPKGRVPKPGDKVVPPKLVKNLEDAGVWQVKNTEFLYVG